MGFENIQLYKHPKSSLKVGLTVKRQSSKYSSFFIHLTKQFAKYKALFDTIVGGTFIQLICTTKN